MSNDVRNKSRIPWVKDEAATGLLAECYAICRSMKETHGEVPDIARAMSFRPDFLRAIIDASRLHFSDGALTRVQHEIIASYVSVLNRCHY